MGQKLPFLKSLEHDIHKVCKNCGCSPSAGTVNSCFHLAALPSGPGTLFKHEAHIPHLSQIHLPIGIWTNPTQKPMVASIRHSSQNSILSSSCGSLHKVHLSAFHALPGICFDNSYQLWTHIKDMLDDHCFHIQNKWIRCSGIPKTRTYYFNPKPR